MGVDAQMFVRVPGPVAPEQVTEWSALLFDRFSQLGGLISDEYALSCVRQYEQDGPALIPEPGEVFIQVALFGRFYSRDYPRGRCIEIIEIAAYLEWLTGGEPWYGGDSGGFLAKAFGPRERVSLKRHYYQQGFDSLSPGKCRQAPIGYCPTCGAPLVKTFSARWNTQVFCSGRCGLS